MPTRQYDFNMYREFMATQLPKALQPAKVIAKPVTTMKLQRLFGEI